MDHKEMVNAAKLQTSMVRLMYATAVPDWVEGTVKDVHLATLPKNTKICWKGQSRSRKTLDLGGKGGKPSGATKMCLNAN